MPASLSNQLRQTTESIIFTPDTDLHNISLVNLYNALENRSFQTLIDHQENTPTLHGDCISPHEAANCMLDTNRTVKFVRGLYTAIKELQDKRPGRRISILYAGSGPFATLALPMTTLFLPDEIGFSVLDIHEASIENVKNLVRILGLEEYFDEYICHDATSYVPEKKPDIVVSETMASGLMYEPQVAITAQLAPQLPEHGIFIPEEIVLGIELSVEAVLKGFKIPDNLRNTPIGDFFKLDKNTNLFIPPYEIQSKIQLPIDIDEGVFYGIFMTTRLKVFGPHILESNEAVITKPVNLETSYKREDGNILNISFIPGRNKRDIRHHFHA